MGDLLCLNPSCLLDWLRVFKGFGGACMQKGNWRTLELGHLWQRAFALDLPGQQMEPSLLKGFGVQVTSCPVSGSWVAGGTGETLVPGAVRLKFSALHMRQAAWPAVWVGCLQKAAPCLVKQDRTIFSCFPGYKCARPGLPFFSVLAHTSPTWPVGAPSHTPSAEENHEARPGRSLVTHTG